MTGRLPFVFILGTIVIDAMGIGLILPVMPDLISEVRGVGLAGAAVWGGVLSAAYAVMMFLCAPALGSLSDRFGRRPVLLVSLAVMAVDYLIMAVAGTIWLLLAGRIVAGIAGATHATALAYMADISPPEKRAQNFGLVSAGFGVGFILGPLVGGLLGGLDPRAPFVAAAVLATLNFAIGFVAAPETLAPENRRAFSISRANPFSGLLSVGRLPGAGALLAVVAIYSVANWVYPAIWAYYTSGAFGWQPGRVGASLAAYGVSMVVVQAGLIRLVIARFGEVKTISYGLVLNVVCLVAYGVAWQGWMIWVLIPISACGAVVMPALQAILSRATEADRQGELQGVLSSINALSMVVSPLVMTQAFFLFTREGASVDLPGAPFLLAAIMMGGAFALFAGAWRSGRNQPG